MTKKVHKSAHYDTIHKNITSITLTRTEKSHYDNLYYNDKNELVKIYISNHELPNQRSASYYFEDDKLICEKIYGNKSEDIKIYNMDIYLRKTDSIYKKVSEKLVEKGHILAN